MAKAPQAGRVKTRLCPPLSPEEAAALHRAFLLDTIERIRMVAGVVPALAYAPADARALFETLAPGFLLVPQRGADLGERMADTIRQLRERGFEAVLLLGADTPSLPAAFLRQAVDAVASPEADLVLGPSEDGGYYLIGLRGRHPELFDGVPWITPEVFAETVRRAEAQGLRTVRLPAWFDVDTPADLARLETSLAATPGPQPRHTRRFFAARPGRSGWRNPAARQPATAPEPARGPGR